MHNTSTPVSAPLLPPALQDCVWRTLTSNVDYLILGAIAVVAIDLALTDPRLLARIGIAVISSSVLSYVVIFTAQSLHELLRGNK
jgi:hypothetical protein